MTFRRSPASNRHKPDLAAWPPRPVSTSPAWNGTPPAELAGRLRIDPDVTLAVSSTSGPTALLLPTSRLHPSTLYRFALVGADGALEASWAAQTAGPLRLVETIPADAATAVRRDAGIELVFDQPGVAAVDLLAHLRIEPATEGHVQVAGRSLGFVPDRPLRRGTLYTVTVTHGLPIVGTDQRLTDDATFRFETSGTVPSPITIGPVRDFIEATPRSAAAFVTWMDEPDGSTPPARVPVTVHRLAGMATAEHAWRAIVAAPTWTRVTTTPAVSTAGLPEVIGARLPMRGDDNGRWIRLPRPLPAGGTWSRSPGPGSRARPSPSRPPTSRRTPWSRRRARSRGSTISAPATPSPVRR